MKIPARFAAKELSLFRRVNENAQAFVEVASRREIDEAIVARVKTADETSDNPRGFAQAEIDAATRFDVESRIADDELKCGIVRAAREKFFRGRGALGPTQIEGKLPALRNIINGTGRAADPEEFLALLTRRSERSQSRIARIDVDGLMLDARAKLQTDRIQFHFFENETGDSQSGAGLQESFFTQDRQFLVKNLGADRAFENADRFMQKFDARIDAIGFECGANGFIIDLVVLVIGVNEFQIRDRKPGQWIDKRAANIVLVLADLKMDVLRRDCRIINLRIIRHAVLGKEPAVGRADVAFVPNIGSADPNILGLDECVRHFALGITAKPIVALLRRREQRADALVQRKARNAPVIGAEEGTFRVHDEMLERRKRQRDGAAAFQIGAVESSIDFAANRRGRLFDRNKIVADIDDAADGA